jgi:hypothetical protein
MEREGEGGSGRGRGRGKGKGEKYVIQDAIAVYNPALVSAFVTQMYVGVWRGRGRGERTESREGEGTYQEQGKKQGARREQGMEDRGCKEGGGTSRAEAGSKESRQGMEEGC